MSLATRCPACHTVFRVVQDQLRVSEGWVRCGQCQEVFNALETLFDLGPLGVAEAAGGVPAAVETAASVSDDERAGAVSESLSLDDLASAPVAEPAQRPNAAAETPPETESEHVAALAEPVGPSEDAFSTSVPAALPEPEPEPQEEEAPTPSRFMGPVPDWAREPSRDRRHRKGKSKPAVAAVTAVDTQAQPHQSRGAQRRRRKPEFVRQAERAAMWRRPMMRALLGGAALLLGAMLLLQAAYQYRDPLAARAPALAPALRTACATLGCRIGAPRSIERLRLDASDLTRTEEEQVLRLTAEVHNTADHPVRTPALDVSFTDALGRTVVRKVLTPPELGARGESLDADAQWRVDARLAVGDLRIAGYSVEVFYP